MQEQTNNKNFSATPKVIVPKAKVDETSNTKPQNKKFRKLNILWIFLLLMLLGVFVVVPVGKIPLLRNLAYAMGYNENEAKEISFLKALLTWNEHAKDVEMERARLLAADEMYAFSGAKVREQQGKLENKLINMRLVNAQLKKEGKPTDQVANSVYQSGNEELNTSADVNVNNPNATAGTQANAAQVGEVYFGSDTTAVMRDKKDGYNSVNTLQKIKNPNIAGASAKDSLGLLMDKAVRADAGLSNLSKNLDKNGMLTQLGISKDLGNHRSQKDMYYAWLMGKAIHHTPNVVLKKTLASASFSGAEMPKTVFNSLGFAGIGIDPNDVEIDVEKIKKYLEVDEKCKKSAPNFDAQQVENLIASTKESIDSLRNSFPGDCGSLEGSFLTEVKNVQKNCATVNEEYEPFSSNACGIALSKGNCTTERVATRFNQFSTYCENEKKKCDSIETEEEKQACQANAKKKTEQDCSGDCSERNMNMANYFKDNIVFTHVDWENTDFYVPENM